MNMDSYRFEAVDEFWIEQGLTPYDSLLEWEKWVDEAFLDKMEGVAYEDIPCREDRQVRL